MPDEPQLRELARAVVTGVGATCTVRDKPVTNDQMEFEIQFAPDGENPIRCFAAWEFERAHV